MRRSGSDLRPLALAYHSLASLTRRQDPSYLAVAPDRFERQVAYLKRRGYRFSTAGEMGRAVRDSGAPGGSCCLTFDDGVDDNAELLPALLDRLGVPATVFICEDLLGEPYSFFADGVNRRFMSREQLLALADHPLIEIGSHTSAHNELTNASAERAEQLLSSSRKGLEDLLGAPVTSLAYPRCTYSPAVPAAAERAGFESAFTCGPRGAWRPYEMPRAIMNSWDRGPTFAAKSRGWFDRLWASPPVQAARWAGKRVGLGPPPPPPPPPA